MASEAEILAARRQRAERLRERGVELFPARVPRPLARIPELVAAYRDKSAGELEGESESHCIAGRILGLRSFEYQKAKRVEYTFSGTTERPGQLYIVLVYNNRGLHIDGRRLQLGTLHE